MGLQPEVQWLANRGYAVLQVNFRGSTGYGKKYLNAGNHEWANKMHDDLLDGKEWLIKKGYAKPDKIAIYGWKLRRLCDPGRPYVYARCFLLRYRYCRAF